MFYAFILTCYVFPMAGWCANQFTKMYLKGALNEYLAHRMKRLVVHHRKAPNAMQLNISVVQRLFQISTQSRYQARILFLRIY